MELQFDQAKWTTDGEGTWLCIRTCEDRRRVIETAAKIKNRKYVAKITEYRERRSLDANAYCWALCSKLAEKLSDGKTILTKEKVYRDAIAEVGIYKDWEDLSPKDAKTLRTAWEMLGTGWITEQVDYMPDGENVVIRTYYGSSTYNRKQMSRLIDNIVQDCKAVGIETATPEELARMKREWE